MCWQMTDLQTSEIAYRISNVSILLRLRISSISKVHLYKASYTESVLKSTFMYFM